MWAITRLDPMVPVRSMYFGITPQRAVQLAIDHINIGDPAVALEMSQMAQLKGSRQNVAFYDFIVDIAVQITNTIPALFDQFDEYPPVAFIGLQGTDLSVMIDLSQTGMVYASSL